MPLITHHRGFRVFLRMWFLALFSVLLLIGCSAREDSLKWTEDVRLPDERIVTLTRYQEFKGPHELGDSPSASDYWFEFKHPDTGETVRWQSDRDLATLALMVDRGTSFLLTKPHFGSSMRRYSCPNPPYLLYRFRQGAWQQIPIVDMPIKKIRVNMTFSPDDSRAHIAAAGYRLSVEETGNSLRDERPYVINFKLLTEQTFDQANCGRKRDYLIDSEG